MTGDPVELALRCYPAWWRRRYADEIRAVVADLTEEGRPRWKVTLNLLGGALRARTRATGMPPVYDLWCSRTRVAIAAATLPWVLMGPLILMAIGGQSLHSTEGRIFPGQLSITGGANQLVQGRGMPTAAPPLSLAGSVTWYADVAMVVLFLITLFVLFAGWSGLTGAIKRSTAGHHRRLVLLAWAPGFSVLADVVLVVISDVLLPHSYRESGGHPAVPLGGHLAAAHAVGTAAGIVAVVGWLVSIVCVAVAVRRADISPLDLRFGKSVSVVVATLLTLTLAAYATWGIGLIVQARQGIGGRYTTIAYSHQDLWPLVLVALLLTVILSTSCASVARRSWKVIALGPSR
jgi:hypothetical protein